MAVVVDVDGLDLWVEPRRLTAEEQAELRRFIDDHRRKNPLPDAETEAVRDLVRRLRATSEAAASTG